MVIGCSAVNCTNIYKPEKEDKNLSFHRFPLKNKDLLQKWLKNMRRKNFTPSVYSRLCSEHFRNEDFDVGGFRKRLLRNAVPTNFNFPKHQEKILIPRRQLRRSLDKECTNHSAEHQLQKEKEKSDNSKRRGESCQTVIKRRKATTQSTKDDKNRLKELLRQDVLLRLEGSISVDLFNTDLFNQQRIPDGNRYSDSVKPCIAQENQLQKEKEMIAKPKRKLKFCHAVSESTETIIISTEDVTSQLTEKELLSNDAPEDQVPKEKETENVNRKLLSCQTVSESRKTTIKSMKDVICQLKQKELFSNDISFVLEGSFPDISLDLLNADLHEDQHSPNGKRYPDNVESFALALYFYSPKAYAFLREHFRLPGLSTLNCLLTNDSCDPGFTKDTLDELKSLIQKNPSASYCSLMIDRMGIMKQVQWDEEKGKFLGYVDYGQGKMESDDCEHATEAFVFMAVGTFEDYKLPVGYFLINGISGTTLAAMIKECLKLLHESGVHCLAVVTDGLLCNQSAAVELGCCLRPESMKTDFPHPLTGEKIYYIIDVCHSLKLLRNLLGESKVLNIPDKGDINWKYLEHLVDLQEKEGIHVATKIRRQHLMWRQEPTKVSIAVQALSASTANALLFLKDLDVAGFEGCETTAAWIKDIDRMFDILNSTNPTLRNFKAPLRPQFQDIYKPFLLKMKESLLSLEDGNGQKVVDTPKRACVIGFLTAISSILAIAEDCFSKNHESFQIRYILTHKFSQEHLETFFNCMRSGNGWNNSPTTTQFCAAYRFLVSKLCSVTDGPSFSLDEISFNLQMEQDHNYFETPDPLELSKYCENVGTPITSVMRESLPNVRVLYNCANNQQIP